MDTTEKLIERMDQLIVITDELKTGLVNGPIQKPWDPLGGDVLTPKRFSKCGHPLPNEPARDQSVFFGDLATVNVPIVVVPATAFPRQVLYLGAFHDGARECGVFVKTQPGEVTLRTGTFPILLTGWSLLVQENWVWSFSDAVSFNFVDQHFKNGEQILETNASLMFVSLESTEAVNIQCDLQRLEQ